MWLGHCHSIVVSAWLYFQPRGWLLRGRKKNLPGPLMTGPRIGTGSLLPYSKGQGSPRAYGDLKGKETDTRISNLPKGQKARTKCNWDSKPSFTASGSMLLTTTA